MYARKLDGHHAMSLLRIKVKTFLLLYHSTWKGHHPLCCLYDKSLIASSRIQRILFTSLVWMLLSYFFYLLCSHSYGEFVFDHSWADAYYSIGSRYYPKLQCCVPFTPVTGPRILIRNTSSRDLVFNIMISALKNLTAKVLEFGLVKLLFSVWCFNLSEFHVKPCSAIINLWKFLCFHLFYIVKLFLALIWKSCYLKPFIFDRVCSVIYESWVTLYIYFYRWDTIECIFSPSLIFCCSKP